MENKIIQKNIPSGWQEANLGDITDLYQPETISKNQMLSAGKYLVFGANGVIGKYNRFNHEDSEVIVTCRGASCGSISMTPKQAWITGNAMVIKVNENKIIKPYIYYFLKNSNLNTVISGGAQPQITRQPISAYRILFPKSKTEQQKIAGILGAVDEDIAKTQEVIEATEKLKRGLMQQLFTRGIGHTKFKETKIGQIPEEWEVVKLSEIAQVERGKFSHRPRNAPEFYGGDIPFIQTGDVVNSNGKISLYTQTLNEKGLSVSKLFKKGTIVITIAANIGDTGILQFDSCFPDSLIGITSSEKIDSIFLEYYLRTQKEYLNSISTQSAQKNINLEKLNPLPIILPTKDEQKKIANILSAVDEKISVNKKLKAKLTTLKKGLMQDLLSGKVRVKN
ncbi:MAG: restriction endonuclease subunit S [Candidatus Gribaldobacteria bacterium]|nr:restriction endonuclease subunit S [Candidatus Gribaldobacteria bacterium]